MKRLLIALVAAVAVSTGFARLTDTQSFEESFSDFVPDVLNQDDSELVAYDNDGPSFAAPYDFDDFGLKYLSLDTGDATLWRTNAGDAAYFDMAMQFNPCAAAPEIDDDTKIAVYLNSSSNLVVLAGDGSGGTVTNVTGTTLNPGTWGRLTIASVEDGFKVILNTNTVVGTFTSRKSGDTTIKAVGFKGSGALDDFVARTTDPFLQNPAATIGGEGYASLADALADGNGTPQLEADASYTIASRGGSVGVKLNNHTLTVTAPAGLYAYPTTSGDVTTYTADYFPRTATAGQDGTAAHPFEVADVDDLQALSAAVAADAATFAGKCYVQTADIDMTSAGAFAGIGGYAANPTEGTPFTGTYDGGNFKILNVDFTQRNYGGIFNQVNGGTIKDLTVSNITCSTYSSGEFGFAIIGNAGNGAVLTNIVAEGVFASAAQPATHNIAGIVVRASAGGTGTLIKDCVNNAALHGAYTKAAGICALTQAKVSGGVVAFDGCENNGSVSMYDDKVVDKSKHAGQDGLAGIVGYVDCNTTIKDCENAGALSSTYETAKVGQIVGWAYTKDSSSVRSLTDLGGNAAPSDARMVGSVSTLANVTGFQYATVDNGVATTVTTLAKDTTYLLEGNVAASATPVFTLKAAGDTIAFDTALGYTFAGTVAAGSSLGVAGPKVNGTVSTYSAGVAAVDDVAYATFAEALAALDGATDTYVTLLANASTSFSEVGEIAVRLNGKTLDVDYGEFAGSSSYNESTGITTYTAATVVATVGTQKFATLQAAIAAADEGETKTVNLVAAPSGAVTIPAGVLVAVPQSLVTGTTFSGITSLVGPGTIRLANGFPPNALCLLVTNAAWNGTLEIYNLNASGYPLYLTNYGNVNSTIRLNQILNATLSSDFQNFGGTLEVGALGWNVTGSFNEIVLPSKLTGSGAITVSTTPASGTTASTLRFTGDVSGFTGNISFGSGSNARVAFGGNKAGGASSIYVHQGSSITNVGTWTAAEVYVTGELVANGTVSGTLKCLNGYTGTYRANSSTAAISADSSWRGTYVVGWNPDSSYSGFVINNYGNSDSVIKIVGKNGAFTALPATAATLSEATAPTINSAVVLDVNWTINNGWANSTTTFSKLSGSGNLIVNGSGSEGPTIPYAITELDGYTGTLCGNRGGFTIGKVSVATQPTDGARVVKTAIGAYGAINDNVPLWVNGSDSGKTLTYDASGAEGAGLYYYEPVVSYDVRFFSDAEKQDQIGDTQSVVSGEKATAPEAPTKSGYTFTGWDPDTNDVITAATDFVAQWSADTYTITYKNADGTPFTDWATSYTAPTSFTVVASATLPTKDNVDLGSVGSKFNGWTNDVGVVVTNTVGLTANLVVFANVTAGSTNWETNPEEIEDNTPASTVYSELTGSALASTDAKKLTVWAKANGKTVGAVAEAAANSDLYDAYLLNCATTEGAIEDAKENFKIPSITFEDGKPVIAEPTGSYNGTIQQKGSNDLSTWTVIDGSTNKAEDFQFFKLELVP